MHAPLPALGRHSTQAPGSMAADEDAPEVPDADALHRPGGHHRSGARPHLRGPGDGRASGGSRPVVAALAYPVGASVGGRESAFLQLVRPALPEGSQRLPALRQTDGPARLLRPGARIRARRRHAGRILWIAAAVAVSAVLAACGGGGSTTAD